MLKIDNQSLPAEQVRDVADVHGAAMQEAFRRIFQAHPRARVRLRTSPATGVSLAFADPRIDREFARVYEEVIHEWGFERADE